MSTKKD